MADRPILFSAPMVRALLDGRKTQTRRVLKPPYGTLEWLGNGQWRPIYTKAFSGDRLWVREAWRPHYLGDGVWDLDVSYAADGERRRIYDGEFGEKEWAWPKAADRGNVSPLHMPRWASRLTLTVIDVRVERLQDISEADAWSEGCKPGALNDRGEPFPADEPAPDGKGEIGWDCARDWYADLWDSLHGPDAWDENPWVAAISFDVRRGNIDEMPK